MIEKPIIFSGPMVRAILEGRKTQTRRIVKPWPGAQARWLTMDLLNRAPSCYLAEVGGHLGAQFCHPKAGMQEDPESPLTWVRLPYAPGDRLWVREALNLGERSYPISHATYAADGADLDLTPCGAVDWACSYQRRLVPPIHMPRWASRLTLAVTDVRVQRLQDISLADMDREGWPGALETRRWTPAEWFIDLWNSLHGPGAWRANPWVMAITFERDKP